MDALPAAQDDAKATRARQIRPALRAALSAMVDEAASIAVAAEKSGMKRRSLEAALRKSHVRDELTRLRRAWKGSETSKAWLTVATLASGAASEDVRLKAAKVILEAAGELGGRQQDDGQSRTLVQIIAQAVNMTAGEKQLRETAPGVFEAPPYLPPAEGED